MSPEEIERHFSFMIEQQACFFADIEAIKERGKQADERIHLLIEAGKFTDQRLRRAIRLAIKEARQEREKRREMGADWTEKLNALINAHLRIEDQFERSKAEHEARQAEYEARQALIDKRHVEAQAEMKELRALIGQLAKVTVETVARVTVLEKANA